MRHCNLNSVYLYQGSERLMAVGICHQGLLVAASDRCREVYSFITRHGWLFQKRLHCLPGIDMQCVQNSPHDSPHTVIQGMVCLPS
jgi:hypothetical protein